jgi:hypothetical protein
LKRHTISISKKAASRLVSAGEHHERRETDMDDNADLIASLTTTAGMIMEDVHLLALTLAEKEGQDRTAALITLAHATHRINALIGAALSLDQACDG